MTNSIKIACTLSLIVLLSMASINHIFAQFQFDCDYNGTSTPGLSLTAIADATPGDPSGTAQADHTQLYTLTDANAPAFFLEDLPGAEVSATFTGLQNGVVYTFCSFNVPNDELADFDALLSDAAAVTDATDGIFANTIADPSGNTEFCYTQVCGEYTFTCPVEFLAVTDPCNCATGIDLDDNPDNGIELAEEIITVTAGVGPYIVTMADGGLVDATGTTIPLAGLTFTGNTLSAYLPADASSTYEITIEDTATGLTQVIMGGPCDPCPVTNNIPTVGEWGLIILALLMSIVAVVGIRERKASEVNA